MKLFRLIPAGLSSVVIILLSCFSTVAAGELSLSFLLDVPRLTRISKAFSIHNTGEVLTIDVDLRLDERGKLEGEGMAGGVPVIARGALKRKKGSWFYALKLSSSNKAEKVRASISGAVATGNSKIKYSGSQGKYTNTSTQVTLTASLKPARAALLLNIDIDPRGKIFGTGNIRSGLGNDSISAGQAVGKLVGDVLSLKVKDHRQKISFKGTRRRDGDESSYIGMAKIVIPPLKAKIESFLVPAAGPLGSMELLFPPSSSLTDAAEITVRGTAKEASSIVINGIAASSSDGFETWQAVVPLDPGENTLTVSVLGTDGSTESNAGSVRVERTGNILYSPSGGSLQPARNRLLVGSPMDQVLLAVDLDTGQRSVVSGEFVGRGVLVRPQKVAVDTTSTNPFNNQRAFVYDNNHRDTIFVVNLSMMGNRAVFSDPETGEGPVLDNPSGMVVDAAGKRLLISDSGLDALVAIDLDTRDRTIIADATHGDGPHFNSPRSVTVDDTGGRALMVYSNVLIWVALANGSRTVFSDAETGSGPALRNLRHAALDSDRQRVIVATGHIERPGLLAVDFHTGDRTVISDPETGSGPELVWPWSVSLDTINQRILVVDGLLDAVITVDHHSGDRQLLSGTPVGTGKSLIFPHDVALDVAAGRALIVQRDQVNEAKEALIAVELGSGDRTVVSGFSRGSGPHIIRPAAVTLDPVNDRALILDANFQNHALFEVDLNSGDRTVLSGPEVGSGRSFDEVVNIEVSPDGREAFIVDAGLRTLLAVNLASGQRRIVSGGATGEGPAFREPIDLALDSTLKNAFVIDNSPPALIEVELGSGDRRIISNAGTGAGPILAAPLAVTLEPSSERALVLGWDSGAALFAIDLTSGDREVISSASRGLGPRFDRLESMDSDAGRIVILDDGFAALMEVDRVSGDRVIISK